jgi:hypothetical protein
VVEIEVGYSQVYIKALIQRVSVSKEDEILSFYLDSLFLLCVYI